MKVFVRKLNEDLVIVHENKLCKVRISKISRDKVVLSIDCDSSYQIKRGESEVKKIKKDREDFFNMIQAEKEMDKKAVAHAIQRNSTQDSNSSSDLQMPEDDLYAPYKYRR